MTLLTHAYSTPVERALEPLRWDADTIPVIVDGLYESNPVAQPHVAEMYFADLFTTILGADYAQAALENAGFLALYRGTQAAIDKFAEIADAHITFTLSGSNIDYQYAPSISSGERQPEIDAFFLNALTLLTPFYLTPSAKDTVDFFESNLFLGGGVAFEDFME